MRDLISSPHATAINHGRRQACLQLSVLAALCTAPALRAANAIRIVSVGGALTEIIYILQAEGNLVGVDTTSLYPMAAQKLPSVGYARALSVEGILSLTPTQIIATEDAGPPAVLSQLSRAGIAVAVLPAHQRFEGLLERVKRVGELTKHVTQAAALQELLQQEWARVRAKVAQRPSKPVRILFIFAHTPAQVMVAGTDTAAQAMLEYVGAINAISEFSGYKPLTAEAVIAAQPDVVLATTQGLMASGGVDGILSMPGLAHTPAGRKRRVISLETMFLLGFGPRMPAALSALDDAVKEAMRL